MFGLSRCEQRWKAEQKAAESLVSLAAVAIKANADVEIAKAKAKEAQALKQHESVFHAIADEKADEKCKTVDEELTERKSVLFSCLMVGDVFIRTDSFGEKDVCMKITEQSNGHNSVYLYGSHYKGRLCTTCDETTVIRL